MHIKSFVYPFLPCVLGEISDIEEAACCRPILLSLKQSTEDEDAVIFISVV